MSCEFDINFDAIVDITAAYERAPEAVEEAAIREVTEITSRALLRVKDLTRVDTGTLRRGWTKGVTKKVGSEIFNEIRTSVEYAPYIEYGHRIVGKEHVTLRFWKGDRMLGKAMEKAREELKAAAERITRAIEEAIDGEGSGKFS